MTTVTAVKRALEEAAQGLNNQPRTNNLENQRLALLYLAKSPYACTALANRLSDMGAAGNAARERNLATLRDAAGFFDAQRYLLAGMKKPATERGPSTDVLAERNRDRRDALQWAIDQLTPPIINRPINTGA